MSLSELTRKKISSLLDSCSTALPQEMRCTWIGYHQEAGE